MKIKVSKNQVIELTHLVKQKEKLIVRLLACCKRLFLNPAVLGEGGVLIADFALSLEPKLSPFQLVTGISHATEFF